MRLGKLQRERIRAAVKACYGEDAVVRLFGSRLDDNRRGGDIDLFIETALQGAAAFEAEQRLYARLQRVLGERRIDIITYSRNTPMAPIHRHALETGEVV